MTNVEAYILAKTLLERNGTNDNLSISQERFAVLYNRARLRFVSEILSRKSTSNVDYLNVLRHTKTITPSLTPDGKGNKTSKYYVDLPDNTLQVDNISGFISNGYCSKRATFYRERGTDVGVIVGDSHYGPSFKFEEVPYIVSDNTVRFFVDGFSVESIDLDYYQKPDNIRFDGFMDGDGLATADIHPILPDHIVSSIIDILVQSFLGVS